MIQPIINCIKCEGFMEEGFIVDRGDYDSKSVSIWVEGIPVKSFWTGIKLKDKQ